MRPSDTKPVPQPFFTHNGLSITTLRVNGKILGWRICVGKTVKEFKVKNMKVLATWQSVEKYVNKYL